MKNQRHQAKLFIAITMLVGYLLLVFFGLGKTAEYCNIGLTSIQCSPPANTAQQYRPDCQTEIATVSQCTGCEKNLPTQVETERLEFQRTLIPLFTKSKVWRQRLLCGICPHDHKVNLRI